MDHLGYRRFAVGGISGGGPYAAAVAACLAPRVRALALISPVGPIADAGCAASLPALHRFSFTVLPRLPALTAAIFGVFRWCLVRSPHLAGRLATLRGGPRDKALIARPEICRAPAGKLPRGVAAGLRGPATDLTLFSRPWGIDLADISAPARLWVGTDDKAVPLVAARALAQRIEGCSCEELDRRGSLLDRRAITRVCSNGSACARSLRASAASAGVNGAVGARPVRPARDFPTSRKALQPVGSRSLGCGLLRSLLEHDRFAGAPHSRPPASSRSCCLGNPRRRSPSRTQRPAQRYSAFPYSWHHNSQAPGSFQDRLPGSATSLGAAFCFPSSGANG